MHTSFRHDHSVRSVGPRGDSTDVEKTAFFDVTIEQDRVSRGNPRKMFGHELPKPAKYTERLV